MNMGFVQDFQYGIKTRLVFIRTLSFTHSITIIYMYNIKQKCKSVVFKKNITYVL